MKKVITLLALLPLLSLSVKAQSMFNAPAAMAFEAEGQAKIQWEVKEHVFGNVPQGKPVTYRFEFTNTGNKDLVLQQVKPSCSCTASDYTKDPIKPGEKGYVEAQYNAAGLGSFTKSVSVTTNTEEVTTVLYLKGTVEAPKE